MGYVYQYLPYMKLKQKIMKYSVEKDNSYYC